ncbi:hypothetical protein Tco_1066361 [Tanacetum coccineum]|uniref:Gag-Pol polyprotein n=1 Tax=Tanacetum coccineum TaxID=301880 RepID=A0ABQ5HB13_9ASTR
MSTSKTYQQSLADAGSETRPPMLERGSYIPWASRFKRFLNRKRENRKWLLKALEDGPYVFRNITPTGSTIPRLQEVEDLQGDDLLYYDAEMELMNMILLSIPNEIYNSVDSCKTAKEMWARVERLMRGTIQNQVDRETRFTNEFDQFVAEPGESLVSVYNRFAQLMNDLERNNMKFPTVSVNTKFLNSLQPEWLKYRNIAIRKGLGYISSLWVMGVGSPERGVTILSLRRVIQSFPIDNTHKWLGVRVNMSRSGSIGWMETTRCAARSGGRLFPWLSFSLALSSEGPPPLTFLFILHSMFCGLFPTLHPSLYRRTLGDLMRRGGVVSLFCSGYLVPSPALRHTPH